MSENMRSIPDRGHGLKVVAYWFDAEHENPAQWTFEVTTTDVIGWFDYGDGDVYPAVMACGRPANTGEVGAPDWDCQVGYSTAYAGSELDNEVRYWEEHCTKMIEMKRERERLAA